MEAADGKKYLTDVASAETLLRLIQSDLSPKAELIFTALAELSTRQIAQSVDGTGMDCLAGYWCCENEITRVVLQSYFTN